MVIHKRTRLTPIQRREIYEAYYQEKRKVRESAHTKGMACIKRRAVLPSSGRAPGNNQPHEQIGKDAEAEGEQNDQDKYDPDEGRILFKVFAKSSAHATQLFILIR